MVPGSAPGGRRSSSDLMSVKRGGSQHLMGLQTRMGYEFEVGGQCVNRLSVTASVEGW